MTGSGVRIPLAAPGARVGFGLVPISKRLAPIFSQSLHRASTVDGKFIRLRVYFLRRAVNDEYPEPQPSREEFPNAFLRQRCLTNQRLACLGGQCICSGRTIFGM